MRDLTVHCLLALATLAVVATSARNGQDPAEGLDPAQGTAALELARPGPEHELLARYVGQWNVEASLRMAPDAEPMTEKGQARIHTILGGRFLQIDINGSFMGGPFESMIVLGFDRRHGKWTSLGFDTFGTYWVSGTGQRGTDGAVRMQGRDEDPMGTQVYTNVVEFKGDDELVYSVDFSQLGKQTFDPPFRMASVRYTRE